MAQGDLYTIKSSSKELIDEVQNLPSALAMIEQLRGGLASRASVTNLRQLIDSLLRGLPYSGYLIDKPLRLFRGRIENTQKTIDDPKGFSYCPKEKSESYGRCHIPGSTVFYGANNLETVLSELLPESGDIIHVGVAQVKPNKKIVFTAIGEIDYIRRYNRALLGNEETIRFLNQWLLDQSAEQNNRALLVDAFFAEEFASPASKQRDYKITALLSELILDAKDDKGNLLLDGFAYPSVGHRGGLNFAIRPDSFDQLFEWKEFMAIEIGNYFGFGLYEYLLYAKADTISSDGKIDWNLISKSDK